MRFLLAACAVVLVVQGPALAAPGGGSAGPAPAAATGPAIAASPQTPHAPATENARMVARALYLDSHVVPYALEVTFRNQMPQMQASITSSTVYQNLTRTRRDAVDAFVATLPQLVNEEVDRAMPTILERSGQDIDDLFSPAHIQEMARFFRTPAGAAMLQTSLRAGVDSSAAGGSATDNSTGVAAQLVSQLPRDQMDALLAFSESPAGIAFAENGQALGDRARTTMTRSFEEITPALIARIRDGFCAALGPQCPAEMQTN